MSSRTPDSTSTLNPRRALLRPTPSRRSVLAAGAAAAATIPLAACGAGSSGGSSSEPVTLRFSWWGADARAAYTQKIIDGFNAAHPNITVKGEWVEWGGYWDRLATNVAANDAPDVIQMDASYLRSYADRGALLDLSQEDGLDTSGIETSALDTGRSDDGLFGLVNGIGALSVYVNTGLFEQAGVQLPDDTSWTWDDYQAVATSLSDAGLPDVRGAANGGLDEPGLQLWTAQSGEHLYDTAGKVVLDPGLVASWWEYQLGLVASGAANSADAAVEALGGSIDQSATALNQVAMSIVWATQLTAYTTAGATGIKLLRPPTQTAGGASGLYYKPSQYWSVSARSKHPQEAVAFLDYLANSPEVADLMLTERGIPSNTALRERITPNLSDSDKAAIDYITSVADVVADPPPLPPAGASSADAMVARYGTDVLFKKQTPAQAAKALVDELTSSVESA